MPGEASAHGVHDRPRRLRSGMCPHEPMLCVMTMSRARARVLLMTAWVVTNLLLIFVAGVPMWLASIGKSRRCSGYRQICARAAGGAAHACREGATNGRVRRPRSDCRVLRASAGGDDPRLPCGVVGKLSSLGWPSAREGSRGRGMLPPSPGRSLRLWVWVSAPPSVLPQSFLFSQSSGF